MNYPKWFEDEMGPLVLKIRLYSQIAGFDLYPEFMCAFRERSSATAEGKLKCSEIVALAKEFVTVTEQELKLKPGLTLVQGGLSGGGR